MRKSFSELYKRKSVADVEIDDTTDTLNVWEKDPIKCFLVAISRGATFESACGFAKLIPTDVRGWLAEAESDIEAGEDTDVVDFYHRYKHADAVFELNNLKVIKTQAENGNWNAAAWLLERRRPESYSPKQEIKATDAQIIIKNDVGKA